MYEYIHTLTHTFTSPYSLAFKNNFSFANMYVLNYKQSSVYKKCILGKMNTFISIKLKVIYSPGLNYGVPQIKIRVRNTITKYHIF